MAKYGSNEITKSKEEQRISGGGVSAEKAKDKAFAKEKERREKEELSFFGVGYDSLDESKREGITHLSHAQRKAAVGKDAFDIDILNGSGRMFALNSLSNKRFMNKKDVKHDTIWKHFKELGVEDAQRLFGETAEKDSTRLFSTLDQITNEAIKLDNYEFFLTNAGAIKTNLARVLLAKIDLDRDMRGTLNDLLGGGKWTSQDPDVVFSELKNRMVNAGLKHSGEYDILLKAFHHVEEIEKQHRNYVNKRQKEAVAILEKINQSKKDILVGAFENDKINEATGQTKQEQRIEYLSDVFKHGESLGVYPSGEETTSSYINKLILHHEEKKTEAPSFLLGLSGSITPKDDLTNKKAAKLKGEVEDYLDSKQKFIDGHNKSLKNANAILEKFSFNTKHYPVAVLASWADEKYAVSHFGEIGEKETPIDIKKINENMDYAIKSVYPEISDEAAEKIRKELQDILSKNKSSIDTIYDPLMDKSNPQRAYIPFESQQNHEDAQNVMRDALYLSLFKHNDEKTYQSFFSNESQKAVITSVLSGEVKEAKPNIDKVNDIWNAISAVTKAASGAIDDKSFDALIDSHLFEDNSVFGSTSDRENLRSLGKELARSSQQLKDREIFGTPEQKEVKNAIQELRYLEAAQGVLDRLDKGKGNVAEKGFKWFLQNNKALRNFASCMDNAKNPITSVESVPSMSRGCLEKLVDEYEKASKEANDLMSNPQSAMTGLSCVGALVIFSSIYSDVSKDRMRRMLEEINEKISTDLAYVENSVDVLQESARKMNVEAEVLGISSAIVKQGFEEKLISESETEHTIRDIVTMANTPLKKDIILNDKEALTQAINATSLDILNPHSKRVEKLKSSLQEEQEMLEEIKASKEQKLAIAQKRIDDEPRVRSILDSIKEEENYLRENAATAEIKEISEKRNHIETLKEDLIKTRREVVAGFTQSDAEIAEFERLDAGIKRHEASIDNLKKEIGAFTVASPNIPLNLKSRITEKGFNLENLSTEERNATIAVLGKYRDNLNRKLLYSDPKMNDQETKNIQKEVDRIDRTMPILHREALADSKNVAETLRLHISDKFYFDIGDENTKSISEGGLKDETIVKILEEGEKKGLSKNKMDNLYLSLKNTQKARRTLSSGTTEDVLAGSTLLSEYLKIFDNGKNNIGNLIKESNNFYATTIRTADGYAFVSGGAGLNGMALYEYGEAEKREDYAKMSKITDQIQNLGATGFIGADKINEMMQRMSKEGNDAKKGNSHLTATMLNENRQHIGAGR